MKSLVLATALALVALPAAAADIDCGSADLVKSKTLQLEACVDPALWQAGQTSNEGQEYVYFSKDGKAGFAIITEQPALEMQQYHDAILAFAAKQSSAADPVKSYDEASSTINGKGWSSMHYDVKLQDQTLEFLNYYYSEDGFGSTQFIFWSLPDDAGAVQSDLASKVMPTVTIVE